MEFGAWLPDFWDCGGLWRKEKEEKGLGDVFYAGAGWCGCDVLAVLK